MYKSRLFLIHLFTLVCLMTLFFSSKLLSAAPAPAAAVRTLAPQDFIQAVNNASQATQNGLQATLVKLLGAPLPQAAPAPSSPPTNDTSASQTPPPAAGTSSSSTTNPPAGTGFNPYSN